VILLSGGHCILKPPRLWSPRVNFINILLASLHSQIPKAQKDTDNLTEFFTLWGFSHVKASNQMLLKSIPGVKFTNILAQSAIGPLVIVLCCSVSPKQPEVMPNFVPCNGLLTQR